ncbi:hypothetical protein ACLMAL_26290 [Nocardia sp. CWNU-33]|uniref:hypothetical protein n=1 Tax=Nocardia sp. CWNU-33 TaxID=3392117 RepID=UPI00398F7F88
MINTKYLDLSNTVANHPPVVSNPQGQAASELVAAGAHHIGFALIAVGLATWGAEPDGHAQMQTRLANQQFDTLSLAPITFAAASAVSSVDVCAAATYRLCVGAPSGIELALLSGAVKSVALKRRRRASPHACRPSRPTSRGAAVRDPRSPDRDTEGLPVLEHHASTVEEWPLF